MDARPTLHAGWNPQKGDTGESWDSLAPPCPSEIAGWKRDILMKIGTAAASLYYASAILRSHKENPKDSRDPIAAAADILEQLAEGASAISDSVKQIEAADSPNSRAG